MTDFEDRVRRALRADPPTVDPGPVLDEVRRGADRRRRRRAAGAVAAGVLAIAAVSATAVSLHGDERTSPEPVPATHMPSPTQAALPAGAERGTIDVSVAAPDAVFRLTTNLGCASCSTVWRQDASVAGGWQRLADFGRTAYRGRVNRYSGPLARLAMAPDGQDGWAWGDRLFSTHDGGRSWDEVTAGPGRLNTEFGHDVALTTTWAWSLLRTDQGMELWRSPYEAEDWQRVTAPRIGGVTGMVAVGDRVALETSGEGLAHPALEVSTDGSSWSSLPNPCPGENQVYPASAAAFTLCTAGTSPRTPPARPRPSTGPPTSPPGRSSAGRPATSRWCTRSPTTACWCCTGRPTARWSRCRRVS